MSYNPELRRGLVALAPTSAGKTHATLDYAIFVDGDAIVQDLVGWPPNSDPPWWAGPDADRYFGQHAHAIERYMARHPDRIVLYNGDGDKFSPGIVQYVVIPPKAELLRNVEAKRRANVVNQPLETSVVLNNAAYLRDWARDHDIPILPSFSALELVVSR